MRLFTVTAAIAICLAVPAFSGAATESTDVPFEMCDGMICIPVTLSDGKLHRFLLDTGDVNSWWTTATAQALGVTATPVVRDDKPLPGVFRLGEQQVSIGGLSLATRFLALEPSTTGELPPAVDGALAYTAFKDRILEIDYRKHRLRIATEGSPASGTRSAEMKLITFGEKGPPVVVLTGLQISGHTIAAQFDSCFTGTVLVYDEARGGLGLPAAPEGKLEYFKYTDGGVNLRTSASRRIEFGSQSLGSGPVAIYIAAPGANPVHQPDGRFEATIGNALLTHSVVRLDFRSMTASISTKKAPLDSHDST